MGRFRGGLRCIKYLLLGFNLLFWVRTGAQRFWGGCAGLVRVKSGFPRGVPQSPGLLQQPGVILQKRDSGRQTKSKEECMG